MTIQQPQQPNNNSLRWKWWGLRPMIGVSRIPLPLLIVQYMCSVYYWGDRTRRRGWWAKSWGTIDVSMFQWLRLVSHQPKTQSCWFCTIHILYVQVTSFHPVGQQSPRISLLQFSDRSLNHPKKTENIPSTRTHLSSRRHPRTPTINAATNRSSAGPRSTMVLVLAAMYLQVPQRHWKIVIPSPV